MSFWLVVQCCGLPCCLHYDFEDCNLRFNRVHFVMMITCKCFCMSTLYLAHFLTPICGVRVNSWTKKNRTFSVGKQLLGLSIVKVFV
jgi:hypothetical protein